MFASGKELVVVPQETIIHGFIPFGATVHNRLDIATRTRLIGTGDTLVCLICAIGDAAGQQ